MIGAFFNLFRLALLLCLALLSYPFLKDRAVFFFLKMAGPSFIKLGQALATRPDLVGRRMAETLAHFQDKLPPFCERKVKKILIKEFGQDYAQIFVEFDFIAKASASIAQVHKAKLANGEIVAVKILRPKIKSIVERDITTLNLLGKIVFLFSRFIAKALKDINLLLKNAAKTELNLLKEAANAMRLKHNLQGLHGFYVPRIFLQNSTKNILVSEWIEGIPFSNKSAIHATKFDKKIIAKNLVISYFTQVYSDGFFHADMHPGNLFLVEKSIYGKMLSSQEQQGPRVGDIVAVDFGIMGEIDRKTRLAVAEIFIGFLHHDYKKVAQLHIDAGFVSKNTNLYDLTLSCQKIGEVIVGERISNISLAALLTNLIEMTHEYEMTTKPELLLLQKTLLLVEGVGMMLDDELNMWEIARPWVKEWAKKNIGFDAKIRDALIDLFEAVRGAISTS